MESIASIIVGIPLFFGLVAGQIFIISRFISIINIKNRIGNFLCRIVYVLFAFVILSFPTLLFGYMLPPHDFHGHIEYASFHIALGIICGIWNLTISIYGMYNLISDWLRKYKQIKEARA